MTPNFTWCAEYEKVGAFLDGPCGAPISEEEYDRYFEALKNSLSESFTISETPPYEDADISMDRWMKPKRCITVCVTESGVKPELVKIMHEVLMKSSEDFSFAADMSLDIGGSVFIVVQRSGEILGWAETPKGEKRLRKIGFKKK